MVPHRESVPGPFSTGTTIEAQTPARRRNFWKRTSAKWSGSATPDVLSAKSEKAPRAEKMGTINGVFIPTTLNVMSILMYLRVFPGQLSWLIVVWVRTWTEWSCGDGWHAYRLVFD